MSRSVDLENWLSALRKDRSDSVEKVDLLNELVESLSVREDPQMMGELSVEALETSRRLGYRQGEANSLLWMGVAQWFTSDLERALSTLLEARATFAQINDPAGRARAGTFIGSVYRSLGDHDQAFLNTLESVEFFREAGDPNQESRARLGLALTLLEMGDFEASVKHSERILELSGTGQEQWMRGRALDCIGAAYSRMGKHREALDHFLQSLKVCQAVGYRMGEARALQDLGGAHERLGDREKAFRYYSESLSIREEIHQREAQCTTLMSLGNLRKEEDGDQAMSYFERALALAKEIGAKPRIAQAHWALSEAFERKEDLAQAIEHLKLHHSLSQEAFEERGRLRIDSLRRRYEDEKKVKEAEIARLRESLDGGLDLGSYRMIERLGSGGMGEVWLGEHRLLARPAAVKVIRAGDSSRPEHQKLMQRFEREAQVTATLRSPHTVQLYDFGVSDSGSFYYVMELLEGMDLRALVERYGPLPPERTVMLLRQACRSLAEAHESGLVHRDIKPANLYVTNLGTEYDFLKVLDFGMVKTGPADDAEQLTAGDVIVGTPAFLAPELILGTGPADARTDLYSLGCTAFWMLTGDCVFQARTPTEMLIQHVQSPPPRPSEAAGVSVPSSLENAILRCLEKSPESRPASAMHLWELLGEVELDSEWTQARARGWWLAHAGEMKSRQK